MKRVLVAGEINVDLVLGGLATMPQPDTETLATSFHQVPGSSSLIFAMGMARLGQPVTFMGHAGDDAYGRFCLDAMHTAGIDTHAVHLADDLTTGVTVALSTPRDRALTTFLGGIEALTADDVTDALLATAGHLHVSALYLQRGLRPGLAGLMERAQSAGVTTSLDPGFDPAGAWKLPGEWEALLRHVNVFLPNRREACAIAGVDDAEAALRAFANGSTCTIIKCGADGAIATDRAGQLLRVPTVEPEDMVDTTGAGDSFDAGFLHAWLAGKPLLTCMRWGNACGALSLRGAGGTARQPDAGEAHAWLEAHP